MKESRKVSKSSKLKKVSIVAGLVLVISASGLAVKAYADNKNYQNLLKSERTAEINFQSNHQLNELKKAEDLADKIHGKDKSQALKRIKNYRLNLAKYDLVKNDLTKLGKNLTDQNIQTAERDVNQLNVDYFAKDKKNFEQEIVNDKEKLEKEKALARAKAEAQAKAEAAKKAAEEAAARATEKSKTQAANGQKLQNQANSSLLTVPQGQKLIALTFDDGPNPATTPGLLQTLQAKGVKATFFPLGYEAQAAPNIIKQEAANGNEVASHTWDHKDLATLSPSAASQEINSAHDLINSLTGQHTNFYRPPYGSYNASVLADSNLAAVNWSVDTNDWHYSSSEPVVQNALRDAHPGAIILLHDSHAWSVGAVPAIIDGLKAQGYTFVTVSQLLASQGQTPQAHQVYFGQ